MKYLLFLIFSFCFYLSFCQDKIEKDSIYTIKITLYNTKYKEFEIIGNSVYTLTFGDSLIKINLSDNSFTLLRNDIKNISKTKQNKIVALTSNKNVIQQANDNNFVIKDTFEGNPHKILVDKNDDFIIITTKYIRYKNENFIPEEDSPMFRKAGRYGGKNALIPIDVYYIDEDRVWFGYDAGEWGGDICSFDLNTKKFIDDKKLYNYIYNTNKDKKIDNYSVKRHVFDFNPNIIKVIDNDTIIHLTYDMGYPNVKGITQNEKGDYYIALSVMHFSIESSLYKKPQTSEKGYYKEMDITDILDHKVYPAHIEEYIDHEDSSIKTIFIPEWKQSLEYLGGVTYNPFDKYVYYYTNNGFWKIIEQDNKYSKEFLFRPWIYWTAGLPDAVGYQMNVVKFDFKSKKELIFLTSNNGLGYFNGKSVIYYK